MAKYKEYGSIQEFCNELDAEMNEKEKTVPGFHSTEEYWKLSMTIELILHSVRREKVRLPACLKYGWRC